MRGKTGEKRCAEAKSWKFYHAKRALGTGTGRQASVPGAAPAANRRSPPTRDTRLLEDTTQYRTPPQCPHAHHAAPGASHFLPDAPGSIGEIPAPPLLRPVRRPTRRGRATKRTRCATKICRIDRHLECVPPGSKKMQHRKQIVSFSQHWTVLFASGPCYDSCMFALARPVCY